MKHTKGPWVVFGDWGIKDTDGRIIATFDALNSDLSNGNSDESFANAALIAAAPDLLEALIKARKDINWMINEKKHLNGFVFDYIDAAIAKAEGL